MSQSGIALTELVTELGFKNPKALSNWIRNIIQDKEDFYKKYAIEQKKEGRANGRDEKFKVALDAKNFIDNLCILKPYMSFFEKSIGNNTNFSPYQTLNSGNHKRNLLIQAQKVKKKLTSEKNRSEDALKKLPKIFDVFESHDELDITKVSLRKLIKESIDNSDIMDFSNSFEIAAWSDLLHLKEELEEKGGSAEIYRELGEKMFELGDFKGAINALNEATSVMPDDVIAWSLKSKIYLDLLGNSRKEQIQALSRTEFSGFIEHPLNGEEYWVNERIEETSTSVELLHAQFIEACFFALEYWPHWEHNKIYHKPTIRVCESDFYRDWLFFKFVMALKNNDLNNDRKKRFIKIFHSFQKGKPDMHPLPELNLGYDFQVNHKTSFDINIIEILNWVSPKDSEHALKEMISMFECGLPRGAVSTAILGRSTIRQLFFNYLGQEQFLNLYSLCESYEIQDITKQRIRVTCEMQLTSIRSIFKQSIELLEFDIGAGFGPEPEPTDRLEIGIDLEPGHRRISDTLEKNEPQLYSIADIDKKNIENSINKFIQQKIEWGAYLNEEIWKKSPYDVHLPKELLSLLFIAPLLEIASGMISGKHIETVSSFVDNREALKVAITQLPFNLVIYLFNLIENNLSDELYMKLTPIFNLTWDIQEEIWDEEFFF